MTNLHRSSPLNQSKIDLGIVNESQLLRFGISRHCERSEAIHLIAKKEWIASLRSQ
jgi:hypothetical protein